MNIICELYNNERNYLLDNIQQMLTHTVNYSQRVIYRWHISNMNENVIIMLANFIHQSVHKRNNNQTTMYMYDSVV